MHREDHNTELSTNVRPSLHPFIFYYIFHPLFEFVSPLNFLHPSFCFLCSSVSLTTFSLSLSSVFRCPADSNVGTTSLQLASWRGEVTETLREHSPGPRVCASACPSSSCSSSRSPPTVAQMRLGCADSADFLSDGCRKKNAFQQEKFSALYSYFSSDVIVQINRV